MRKLFCPGTRRHVVEPLKEKNTMI